MCGIVGYIGTKKAAPILLNGLRRLEYRGYDSSGIATLEEGSIKCIKAVGKIDELAEKVNAEETDSTLGIAHTRWATHGEVTEKNAHPHIMMDGKLALAHNGIIENYRELKKILGDKVEFKSQTDSEVLGHLIAQNYDGDLRKAVEAALAKVRGTYGVVVMHVDHPNLLVAARFGSPLVIGIADDGNYIASDATPILPYTKKCMFLDDGEVVAITREKVEIFNLMDESIVKCVEEIDWDEAQAQKGGFDHFMLKEIFDQPTVIQDAIRGRYNLAEGTAFLGGINMTINEMRKINRIILLACGTASYACQVGKFAFERLASIPTSVEIASEFRYSDPIIDEKTLVFAVSQSGETADTLAALREAKRRGAYVRGIVNAVGSTIARETDGGSYIHAGPELAVASTKAYTNMIAIMILYALQFGRLKRVSLATGERLLKALLEIPDKMKLVLDKAEQIEQVALKYKDYKDFYFLGRGINYAVALEGSLKLKEITYIHSEAYSGGEMKHGPIALLSKDFPVFGIATKNQLYDKMVSNLEEAKARGAKILLVTTEGDERAGEIADDIIYVPSTMELLEPLINTLATQLFAYYVAVALGRDVDRPRNLAKSVTVE